jgi:Ca2+-binding RTX toxin-like protein
MARIARSRRFARELITRRHTVAMVAACVVIAASVAVLSPLAHAAKPKCFGRNATIVGTSGDDELDGTNGRDVIVAKRGNDTIDARGGRDFICSGRGGFDVVFAGNGNDRIDAQRGFDVIFPGAGNDFADGGSVGAFVTYEGSSTAIRADLRTGLVTGQGRDTLRNVFGLGGSESGDVLEGTNGFNDLEGLGGDDVIRGRGGEFDFLNAGAGNDTVSGGGGTDALDLVIAHGGPGIGDDVLATSGADVNMPLGTVTGGADVGTDTFTGIEEVGTTLGDDSVIGTDGNNLIFTWDGTDDIQAGDGDDVVAPGPGDDTVDGGAGIDFAEFFPSHPFEPGMDGPVTVDLGAGTATGQGTDAVSSFESAGGTLLDDTLIGSNGDDALLLGDEGSDDISGGPGDDLLDGDAFFFGFPENLPGTDDLDGGPGTNDICVGGETVANCESDVLPGSLRGETALRMLGSRANTYYAPILRWAGLHR